MVRMVRFRQFACLKNRAQTVSLGPALLEGTKREMPEELCSITCLSEDRGRDSVTHRFLDFRAWRALPNAHLDHATATFNQGGLQESWYAME